MTHTTTPPDNKVHEGRNVKRFREMLGIKQEALAAELGDDWTQKKVSLLEAKDTIEPALLQQISAIWKIPVEAIQTFDEEQALNVITNSSFDNGSVGINYYPTFNPIDKIIELYDEKVALYERMLKEKDEMMATLKALLEK